MSKNEKSKKVLENTVFFSLPEHNALYHQNNNSQFVSIKNIYFFAKKSLGEFSVLYLGDKWMTKTRQKSPQFFIAKFVTINAANRVISTSIV